MDKSNSLSFYIPSTSLVQKNYGKPKPVREFHRFLKDKIANTGSDPKGNYSEFIKNDLIKPITRSREPLPKIETTSQKWALRTDKNCPSEEKVPRIQQFKEYFFPNRTQEEIDNYRSSFLKSDYVSIRIPKIKKKQDNESFLFLKNKFGVHTETLHDAWLPQGNFKTMNNRSSVVYNIINQKENNFSGCIVMNTLDKKVASKKKGLTEFSDLTRIYHHNLNPKHEELLKTNPNIFQIHKGIFSQIYDAAHKNGNIILPFSKEVKKVKDNHN
jgi:hypothetical protein